MEVIKSRLYNIKENNPKLCLFKDFLNVFSAIPVANPIIKDSTNTPIKPKSAYALPYEEKDGVLPAITDASPKKKAGSLEVP